MIKPENWTKYKAKVGEKTYELWFVDGVFSNTKQKFNAENVEIISLISHLRDYRKA